MAGADDIYFVDGNDELVDEDLIAPDVDIHALFCHFDKQYFQGRLAGVEVKWSSRMTLCAGLCEYKHGVCQIKLSEKLLQFRPRRDLVNTLLHEMIHAYLFLTQKSHDRDGHGEEFVKLMSKINMDGHNVTVFHNFHDEVEYYRQHWWQCNKCKRIVKRAMNRAPGPQDPWWDKHVKYCGGTYIKIKEPQDYGKKSKGKKKTNPQPSNTTPITSFFPSATNDESKTDISNTNSTSKRTMIVLDDSDDFEEYPVIHTSNSNSTHVDGSKDPELDYETIIKTDDTSSLQVSDSDNEPEIPLICNRPSLRKRPRPSESKEATITIKLRLPSGGNRICSVPANMTLGEFRLNLAKELSCKTITLSMAGRTELHDESSTLGSLGLSNATIFVNYTREDTKKTSEIIVIDADEEVKEPPAKRRKNEFDEAQCPVCGKIVPMIDINQHLDECVT